ncbi:MAG: protein phosphatase 2C domain-containing protein [Aphanizomenon sp.]
MENDVVTLCCPKEYCQFANPLTNKFCEKCSTPLPKRYLWAVDSDFSHCQPGSILDDGSDRYLVINKSILLDIKPGLLPQMPELDDLEQIRPYLKLIPYRCHVPQVYGVLNGQSKQEILLLEKPPLISDTDITQVSLCSSLDTAWSDASSIRQIHWLWQLANLWQPLTLAGVSSTLLDPYVLRVEGVLIRFLELRFDGEKPGKLSQLGEFWRKLLKDAKPNIAPFIQQVCEFLIQGEINSSSELIQVLDQGLSQLGKFQTTTIKICTKTDPGPSRPRNEDACYPPGDDLITKLSQDRDLAIVCDGIGGHDGGSVASNLAIKTMEQEVEELTLNGHDGIIHPFMVLSALERAVATANDEISERNDKENRQGRQRMGTTIVMSLSIDHEIYIAHVGDSRAYWITAYSCYQVTLDDDVASREVRLGYSLYREALQHRGSGSLVQALGMSKSTSLHPTSQRFIIDEDAVFLLTSDGLSDFDRVEESWDTEILPLLSGKTSIENVAQRLIEIANTKNGHDNVTIALIHYHVEYSEPDITIAVDLSGLLPSTELDIADNNDGFINNQKTKVMVENKTTKVYPIPLQLFVILGLSLLAGLLGYWFKLQLKSPTISPPTNVSGPFPPAPTQINLDNLSPNAVIEANSSIIINNKTFSPKSLFEVQVIERKASTNAGDDPEVVLRVCEKSKPASKIIKVSFSELRNLDVSVIQSNQDSCKK